MSIIIYHSMRLFLIFIVLFQLSACVGSVTRALKIESKLVCGMTMSEVFNIAESQILPVKPNKKHSWATHKISNIGKSTMLLGFDGDELRYVKIIWDYNVGRTASLSTIDLCLNEMID